MPSAKRLVGTAVRFGNRLIERVQIPFKTRRSIPMRNFTFLIACVALGCSQTVPGGSGPTVNTSTSDEVGPKVTVVQGSVPTDEQQAKLLAAKDALFEQLSGRLMQAMGEGGPAAAILVCQKEAPEIAKSVGERQGVSIGRTGVRLRNPNNQPPGWANEFVGEKTDKPTFVNLSDDRAAAFLPIKLQVQCLMCHGPDDQIAPDVKDQLQQVYPGDQATGFHEGDLRGWFWVTLNPVD